MVEECPIPPCGANLSSHKAETFRLRCHTAADPGWSTQGKNACIHMCSRRCPDFHWALMSVFSHRKFYFKFGCMGHSQDWTNGATDSPTSHVPSGLQTVCTTRVSWEQGLVLTHSPSSGHHCPPPLAFSPCLTPELVISLRHGLVVLPDHTLGEGYTAPGQHQSLAEVRLQGPRHQPPCCVQTTLLSGLQPCPSSPSHTRFLPARALPASVSLPWKPAHTWPYPGILIDRVSPRQGCC